MPLTGKILGSAVLTGTSAAIYTVPSATVARVAHIFVSNGATAGTVTITVTDTSGSVTRKVANAVAIGANEVLEYFDLILEATDVLNALAGTTTDAEIVVMGYEET